MTLSHLSTRELADRWNVSRRTLDRWRWAGEGPRFLKLGGRVVYRIADIEAFEQQQLRTRTDLPANLVLAKVEAGDDPTAEAAAAATFQKIAARFIAEYAQPRNRTWRDTERILRVYCAPWASRDITTIDRRDVRELLETVARDHGPIMSNRTLSAARKLLSWSLERDIIPANPAAKMEPVAKEISRDRVLSDAELRAFWRATVEMPTPWGPYFRIALFSKAMHRDRHSVNQ